MLKSQGAINWNRQIGSLITHTMFIINVSISVISDIFVSIRKWQTKNCCCYFPTICCALFYISAGLLTASMAYAPVSIVMVGSDWGRIDQQDYLGVIEKKYMRNWLKVLIALGYVGQFAWFLLVPLLTLAYYGLKTCCSDCDALPSRRIDY